VFSVEIQRNALFAGASQLAVSIQPLNIFEKLQKPWNTEKGRKNREITGKIFRSSASSAPLVSGVFAGYANCLGAEC
jgi:hypothetical protein